MGAKSSGKEWSLRLYVAGSTPKSIVALSILTRVCEEHLRGLYQLEVIDLEVNPQLSRHDQIIAIPTLIRLIPLPVRRITGYLSDRNRLLVELGLASSGGLLGLWVAQLLAPSVPPRRRWVRLRPGRGPEYREWLRTQTWQCSNRPG